MPDTSSKLIRIRLNLKTFHFAKHKSLKINNPCLKLANNIQNRISHWLQLANDIATQLNENDDTCITLGTIAGTRGLGKNGQEGLFTAYFFVGLKSFITKPKNTAKATKFSLKFRKLKNSNHETFRHIPLLKLTYQE